MDAVVQLIRNFLCCVKDLQLFTTSLPFLYDPSFLAKFYTFPGPHMSKTTLLELLIAISQLYAAISCSRSGFDLIVHQGVKKLMRLSRVADALGKHYENLKKENDDPNGKQKEKDDNDDDKKKKEAAKITLTASQILSTSLVETANTALRSTFVGLCVFPIGISFFWLFANSLHLTEAGTIGGLPALIHALTVMEVALLPLLYFMVKDGTKAVRRAARIRLLIGKFGGKVNKDVASRDQGNWLKFETYTLFVNRDWKPFWSGDIGPDATANANVYANAEERMMEKEVEAVERHVKAKSEANAMVLGKEDALELEAMAKNSVLEGYREYLYFLFNFIAFYGYLLGVVVYYFPEAEAGVDAGADAGGPPGFVRHLKLGYSHDDADWGGNFAGDLMWTVEPIVILASPMIFKMMVTAGGKTKSKTD